MKTIIISSIAAALLVSFTACEEGEREHHHHHDHDRDREASVSTTTTTEETTIQHRPVGATTETRVIREY